MPDVRMGLLSRSDPKPKFERNTNPPFDKSTDDVKVINRGGKYVVHVKMPDGELVEHGPYANESIATKNADAIKTMIRKGRRDLAWYGSHGVSE